VTHHKIRELADGTRVYSNGTRYKPMADAERTKKVRKPQVEGALLYQGVWYLPLSLCPDGDRVMPETRSDELGYSHGMWCRCVVCARPAVDAQKWRRWKKPPRRVRS
jgi:hypothetical protein